MKVTTQQEHQGTPEQQKDVCARAVETQWNRIIDEDRATGPRPDYQPDLVPADRGDAVDRAYPSMSSPMRIDSILPDLASPGQSVIIQGNNLGTTKKIFFDDQEVSFTLDGRVLVVPVPGGAGAVGVTVEGVDGESCVVKFTIAESRPSRHGLRGAPLGQCGVRHRGAVDSARLADRTTITSTSAAKGAIIPPPSAPSPYGFGNSEPSTLRLTGLHSVPGWGEDLCQRRSGCWLMRRCLNGWHRSTRLRSSSSTASGHPIRTAASGPYPELWTINGPAS